MVSHPFGFVLGGRWSAGAHPATAPALPYLAETISGLYTAELIHRRAPWKTKESVELAALEGVAWFNAQRLLEPIGYIPPAEAEANYYRQLVSPAVPMAA